MRHHSRQYYEVQQTTISNQKVNPTWYCWMEVPKATVPDNQSSLQVYQIPDWALLKAEAMELLKAEAMESHNENLR
jgi:hypothetical protein